MFTHLPPDNARAACRVRPLLAGAEIVLLFFAASTSERTYCPRALKTRQERKRALLYQTFDKLRAECRKECREGEKASDPVCIVRRGRNVQLR